MITFVMQCNN